MGILLKLIKKQVSLSSTDLMHGFSASQEIPEPLDDSPDWLASFGLEYFQNYF